MHNRLYGIAVALALIWALGVFVYHAGQSAHILLAMAVTAVSLRLSGNTYAPIDELKTTDFETQQHASMNKKPKQPVIHTANGAGVSRQYKAYENAQQ